VQDKCCLQLPPQTRTLVPFVLLLGILRQSLESSASQAVLEARGIVDASGKSRPFGILNEIRSSAIQYVL
jgi:hypothetical protein